MNELLTAGILIVGLVVGTLIGIYIIALKSLFRKKVNSKEKNNEK